MWLLNLFLGVCAARHSKFCSSVLPFEYGGVSLLYNSMRALLRFGGSTEAQIGIEFVLLLADLGRG